MDDEGFLHRYFLNNPSKRLHKWTHYFDIYERHFKRFRGLRPTVLEIGVMGGGSLAMWREYFGEGCQIVGLDNNPTCKQHESERIDIHIGSQDDSEFVAEILEKYQKFDVVIDDGSHLGRHQIASFNFLYERLSPIGVYLVEDTHANYWSEYEGGLKKPGTFIEFCKDKIDELNAVHARGAVSVSEFTAGTASVSFYDSVVVFEKMPQTRRQAPITIGMLGFD